MRKLAMKLDDLQVESFTTSSAAAQRGTVAGHDLTNQVTCGPSCGCPPSAECTYGTCPFQETDTSCRANNCGTLIEN
jgi:hypothetical protein